MSVPGEFPQQYSPSIDTELVQRARDLRTLFAANAAEAETQRRLPDSTVGALAEAGLFKLTVPRRYGGHETNFATVLAVAAEVARACGSTAWVTTLINICNWAACVAPEEVRADIFGADPDARVCSVLALSGTATHTDDGYRVSGSWGFASGCMHATWATVGVQIVDEAGQVVQFGQAGIPMDQFTIKDTWHVAGMRGTGSNTLIAEDVVVPAHLVVPSFSWEDEPFDNHPDEPLYRTALVPALILVLAGPQLGMARAALDHTLATIDGRGIAYTFYDQAVRAPSTQFQVAQAGELVDTAALHIFRAATLVDQAASEGRAVAVTERLQVRMDTSYAVTRCRQAIDLLLDVNGASSFAEANPLQRLWRDSAVAARHATVIPGISTEAYGRALLGIKEQMTLLI